MISDSWLEEIRNFEFKKTEENKVYIINIYDQIKMLYTINSNRVKGQIGQQGLIHYVITFSTGNNCIAASVVIH